jgi:hypothetical protein
VPNPGIAQLLIDSALKSELRRRLEEAPEEVFGEYSLSAEERALLRAPDHRLLPLLAEALGAQTRSEELAPPASPAPAVSLPVDSQMLPDAQMALTVIPCLVGGQIAYAAWIAPMHEGADPSRMPPPPGAMLPGQPLTPLHAVIQVSGAQLKDAGGNLRVNLWASFRQSTNAASPASAASAVLAPEVRAAAAAVHAATPAERYEKLLALAQSLEGGGAP